MKFRYVYILWVLMALLPVSCSLQQQPESYASKKEIFSSDEGLRSYAYSFYWAIPSLNDIPICEASNVDYAACRSYSNFYCFGAYTAESNTSWDWSELRKINYFIDGLHSEDCTVSAEVRNNYEGIARWFRAWFYYGKLTTYGAVPWFDHCLSNDEFDEMYKNRDSRDVIIGHIIDDLDFAFEHIQAESSHNNTMISKYTALALKSRACLFEASWRKYHGETENGYTSQQLYGQCIDASQKLIDAKVFSLNKTAYTDNYITTTGAYRSLFYCKDVVTSEVILGVEAWLDYNVSGNANRQFNSGSYGNSYCLSRAFVFTYLRSNGLPFTDQENYSAIAFKDEFANRDDRLRQTVKGPSYRMSGGTSFHKVADIVNNVAPTGYHPIKFVEDATSKDNKAKNENCYPVFRYAEVLLNYAEALAETGAITASDWRKTIGAIRERAGINDSNGALSTLPKKIDGYLQQMFYPDVTNPVILEIRRERAIELVYEGFRVDDLNRWAEGHCFESVPWTGIHFADMDTPIDVNSDGVADYYFTHKGVFEIPAEHKGIYVYVLPEGSTEQGLYADANPAGGYDLRYELSLKRKWYDDDRQYLRPVPAQIVRDYANRGYVIDQNPGW